MPKQRITKEMVVNTAFEIARSQGMEQVLVKNIADKMGCSVQPIYSYCRNMAGLRQDVARKAAQFIQAYLWRIYTRRRRTLIWRNLLQMPCTSAQPKPGSCICT